jgi:peptidoglycan LD-endopeptidase CwlK
MANWGRASIARRDTCTPAMQELANDVIFALPWKDEISQIVIRDISLICGHRDELAQDLAYKDGKSTVKWPDSMHNRNPSPAFDMVPYHSEKPHIHWKDIDGMEALSRLVIFKAQSRGMEIRWGGDWDRDGVRVDRDPDERFLDGPHYEDVT